MKEIKNLKYNNMNKLALEDQYLNISQVKELEELGIEIAIEDCSMVFYPIVRIDLYTLEDSMGYELGIYKESENQPYSTIPTISILEMIEMLPLDIKAKSEKYGSQTVYLSIDRRSVMYSVSGNEFEDAIFVYKSFEKQLLRDALFEMLKWLKQNKLI